MALRIAALASGRGSNVGTIIKNCQEGRLDGSVELVLCNIPGAPVLHLATSAGVPVWCEDHKASSTREAFDQKMVEAIRKVKADIIVLAGYMRLLSPLFVQSFPGRIINIHPSLLPAFTGAHGPDDAADYGVKLAGCTVHFVNEHLDDGPIILQAAISLSSEESASDFMPRVHALEHRVFSQALQWVAEDRLHIEGRKVVLRQGSKSPLPMPEGCLISPPLEHF